MEHFESELYAPLGSQSYFASEGETPLTNLFKNKANRTGLRYDSPNKTKEYSGLSSIVSGLFFSGVGYAVGVTGSIIRDVASYVLTEAPKIPSYLSDGIDPNTIQQLYNFAGESLSHANSYGGVAAALGFFGGAFFMVKLKSSTRLVFNGLSSIFRKNKQEV
jgi:hypothetical protein